MSGPAGAPDCVFCAIAAGELEADVVFSDEDVVAFSDIAPAAPTHLLVVPRRHLSDVRALSGNDGALLATMVATANRLADRGGLTSGYRLVLNVGEDAGNTVPHLHLHLLGGRAMAWPPG